jgi:WD40 repeat protein
MFRLLCVVAVIIALITFEPEPNIVKAKIIGDYFAVVNQKYNEVAVGLGTTIHFYSTELRFLRVVELGEDAFVFGLQYIDSQDKLAVLVSNRSVFGSANAKIDLQIRDAKSKNVLEDYKFIDIGTDISKLISFYNYNSNLFVTTSGDIKIQSIGLNRTLERRTVLNSKADLATISIDWSPAGNVLSITKSNEFTLLDGLSGGVMLRITPKYIKFFRATWSPGGDYIAISERYRVSDKPTESIIRLLNVKTGAVDKEIDLDLLSSSEYWLSNGNYMVVAYSGDDPIQVRDDQTFEVRFTITDFPDLPRQIIDVLPGKTFLIVGSAGIVHLRDTTNGDLLAQINLTQDPLKTLAPTLPPARTRVGTPLPEGGSR